MTMREDDIKLTKIGGESKVQKLILQANIPFIVLKDYARFTYMDDSANNNNYQRRIEERRIPEIKNFIRESILKEKNGNNIAVLFPTAMLLASRSENDTILEKEEYDWKDIFNDGTLPEFMIVDGQHRLRAMIDLYESIRKMIPAFQSEEDKYIKNYLDYYRFNCTLLVNFDMWEQAQIFADVNFTQKKVSKDLYYSIYGMNPPSEPIDYKKNCIYIAHNLVKFLNTNEKSPFRGFIRMLGNGNGVISQAAMADSFIEQMRTPSGMWYINPYGTPKSHKHMAVETILFFSEIKELFSNLWINNGKHVSILCKTTGFAALVKLMRYIHIYKLNKLEKSRLDDCSIYDDQEYKLRIKELLKPLKEHEFELFGSKGQFAGSGGKGMVIKLYERMIGLLK